MRKVKTRIKTDRFHGDGREGGSLLYVIFFITLLSVFACGFMAVSRYHIKMALKNRAYMEARLTTHMIHNSFCEAVSKGESDALLFMSKGQAKALAQLVVSGNTDKKAYKEAMQKEPSYDMALFGRMVASDPSLNYDAAAQVAHSISTHTIHNEYDYFTAVDDCSQEDNAGAGHLGTVEFNSFTMYRYATVNVMELYRHLGKDTAEVVEGFIKAFICSMPTGKQNTFANRTLPDAVYITVRKDQPLNLCGAFERPILSNCGYVDKSVEAMTAYAKKVYDNYADEPEKAFGIGDQLEGAAEVMSLKQLLESVKTEIQAQLDDGGEE